MPTETGGETIGERLTRLRTALARVQQTISRAESNGQEFRIGLGTAVTQIAYEQAQERERKLTSEIRTLEARLAGAAPSRIAVAFTKTP